MRWAAWVLPSMALVLWLVSQSGCQRKDPAAVEILKKADAAAKSLTAVKYEVTFEVLRGPAGPIPRAEATV